MATIVNARDVLLQAASPRVMPVDLPGNLKIPALKMITITYPTNVFKVSSGGTVTPTTILLTANLIQISGTVTWAVTSGTATLTGSGNSRTVTNTTMLTDSITVRASVTDSGTTYTYDVTINKVRDGTSGTSGSDGRRSASGYVYYGTHSSSNPGTPSATDFNFDSGAFTGLSSGWSATFTAPTPTGAANAKYWASRYNVSEVTAGGAKTITFTVAFNWQNFDGLVTFTNLATNSGVTFIDGANITTGTLAADRIKAGEILTGASSNAKIQIGNYTSISGFTSSMNLRKQSAQSNHIMLSAMNNVDGSVAIWGAMAAGHSGHAVSGTWASINEFSAWRAIGTLGAGLESAAVWGRGYGSGFMGAKFEYSSTSDASSGTSITKRVSLANSSYAISNASGEGKYYFPDGAGPFTGFHPGLAPRQEYTLGDIVVDDEVVERIDISNVITTIKLSTQPYERGVLGVISEIREMTHEVNYTTWWTYLPTHYLLDVNGIGEGQINVCGLNGNIKKGDLIVASAMPGKGMRQDDEIVYSYTVARARENVVFDSPEQVKLCACIYVSG